MNRLKFFIAFIPSFCLYRSAGTFSINLNHFWKGQNLISTILKTFGTHLLLACRGTADFCFGGSPQ